MMKNFPNLVKEIDIQYKPRKYRVPNKMNPNRLTQTHYN